MSVQRDGECRVERGWGSDMPDEAEAFVLYMQAAQQGHPIAAYNVGNMLDDGFFQHWGDDVSLQDFLSHVRELSTQCASKGSYYIYRDNAI